MTGLVRRGRGFAVALLFACFLPLNVYASDQPISYDGQWWLSIGEKQREGFLYGFIICYANLVDRNTPWNKPISLSLALTKYLQDHPESRSQPVERTLLNVNTKLPVKKPPFPPNETPEESAAKWGANNDGDDWRGPDTNRFELGYIQGFLQCYSKHTKQEYGTFSKSPEWYVKAIADWYGTGPDPDQINLEREQEKIPEVLFRFRDK